MTAAAPGTVTLSVGGATISSADDHSVTVPEVVAASVVTAPDVGLTMLSNPQCPRQCVVPAVQYVAALSLSTLTHGAPAAYPDTPAPARSSALTAIPAHPAAGTFPADATLIVPEVPAAVPVAPTGLAASWPVSSNISHRIPACAAVPVAVNVNDGAASPPDATAANNAACVRGPGPAPATTSDHPGVVQLTALAVVVPHAVTAATR
jgi:hypothetical protein